MLLHTTDIVPGQEIVESLGMVRVHLWNPNNSFLDVLEERLCQKAADLGADAVVAVRIDISGSAQDKASPYYRVAVLSGTAVRLRPGSEST